MWKKIREKMPKNFISRVFVFIVYVGVTIVCLAMIGGLTEMVINFDKYKSKMGFEVEKSMMKLVHDYQIENISVDFETQSYDEIFIILGNESSKYIYNQNFIEDFENLKTTMKEYKGYTNGFIIILTSMAVVTVVISYIVLTYILLIDMVFFNGELTATIKFIIENKKRIMLNREEEDEKKNSKQTISITSDVHNIKFEIDSGEYFVSEEACGKFIKLLTEKMNSHIRK